MLASYNGYYDIVQLLIASGANINLINKNKNTAYDLAENDEIRNLIFPNVAKKLQNTITFHNQLQNFMIEVEELLNKLEISEHEENVKRQERKQKNEDNLKSIEKRREQQRQRQLQLQSPSNKNDILTQDSNQIISKTINNSTDSMIVNVNHHNNILLESGVRTTLPRSSSPSSSSSSSSPSPLPSTVNYKNLTPAPIDYKVDIESKSHSALCWAAIHNHKDVLEMLISTGANINLQNKDGNTALILSSYQGHTDIVSILIKANADINLKNKDGYTAYDISKSEDIKTILSNNFIQNNQDSVPKSSTSTSTSKSITPTKSNMSTSKQSPSNSSSCQLSPLPLSSFHRKSTDITQQQQQQQQQHMMVNNNYNKPTANTSNNLLPNMYSPSDDTKSSSLESNTIKNIKQLIFDHKMKYKKSSEALKHFISKNKYNALQNNNRKFNDDNNHDCSNHNDENTPYDNKLNSRNEFINEDNEDCDNNIENNIENDINDITQAADCNLQEKVLLFLASGEDIDYQNKYGNTALILSSFNNDIDMVFMLLSAGADVNIMNNNCKTAYDITSSEEVKNILTVYSM